MSPEHTAHTRRAVDSRSDLYSLGVVLYELLTGCLPFTLNGNSPAEWAHHHVASEPRPPHEARPGLPPVLSEILLRLLAKTPEGRYQTVDGLIADLRRCQATLAGDETIAPFTPGLQDRAFAFHLADALGTTHPQVREVLNDFDEVSRSGLSRLVIISGPSGIGKSSLLASALKALHPRNALLAVGKVDQFAPALPWAVLTAAFRSLTLHLLGLPSEEVAQWRSRLSRALDGYEELAVSLVPELGSLLEIRPGFHRMLELACVWLDDVTREALIVDYAQRALIDATLLRRQVARWRPWSGLLMAGWYERRFQETGHRTFITLADEAWRQLRGSEYEGRETWVR